ncbi:MAG: 50S ribosomal protein L18 [SAR324 cluster bacterium]|nr:50S ribosomal protein L18 [SAR324 cluster bacterium]
MIKQHNRKEARRKIKARISKKLRGSTDRPRVSVYRSLNHISAQVIDDDKRTTIASVSTTESSIGTLLKNKTANIAASKLVGQTLTKRLLEKGVNQVVFDRNGFLYHGAVRALAEALREGGIKL